MNEATSNTHILRIFGVVKRLRPEDLGTVRGQLQAAGDGVTELALCFPADALVFSICGATRLERDCTYSGSTTRRPALWS